MVAVDHLAGRLNDKERRRIVEIVRTSKGRPSNLSDRERKELQALLAKVEPRELLKTVGDARASPAVFAGERTRRERPPRFPGAAALPCHAYLEMRARVVRRSRGAPVHV